MKELTYKDIVKNCLEYLDMGYVDIDELPGIYDAIFYEKFGGSVEQIHNKYTK